MATLPLSNDSAAAGDALGEQLGGTGGEDFIVDIPGPKKPSPALVGVLVAAVIGGGVYLYLKHSPTAAADVVAADASAGEARKTITEFLSTGGKDVVAMEEMLRNTEQVVQQFLTYPSMTQVPLSDLSTNPFRFAPPPAERPTDADELAKKAEARAAALKAASAVSVQSILSGGQGKGTALVNGTMVSAGDRVDRFVVEEIRASSIVIRDETFRFEIKLTR